MKVSQLCFSLLAVFLMQSAIAKSSDNEQVMADEVPANVKNSFNRIYIDHDPDSWFVEVVKPKGGKKTRRFTATFENNGRTHSVRFEESGRAIGEYYELNQETSKHITDKLTIDFPNYEINKVESVWIFRENISAFKVSLARKAKTEIVFLDDAGNQMEDDILQLEFTN